MTAISTGAAVAAGDDAAVSVTVTDDDSLGVIVDLSLRRRRAACSTSSTALTSTVTVPLTSLREGEREIDRRWNGAAGTAIE